MIYRIEIRRDIEADTDQEVRDQAFEIAQKIGGEVTAIFDEKWEEIDP